MAQFATVTWTGAAEVTSNKLQQMSNNDEWLKENMILGDIAFLKNSIGKMGYGREEGIVKPKKIMGVNIFVDSQVPVSYTDVIVRYPVPFTTPPLVFVTPAFGPSMHVFVRVLDVSKSNQCTIRVNYGNTPSTKHLMGELNVLAIGY